MPDEGAKRCEQKAQWMAKAGKQVGKLLGREEWTKHANLTQIEDKVLELRKRMSAAMAATALER